MALLPPPMMPKLLVVVIALLLIPTAAHAQCRGSGVSAGRSDDGGYSAFVTEKCEEEVHLAALVVFQSSDPRWRAPFLPALRPAEEEFNEWTKAVERLPQFEGVLFGGTTSPKGALMVGWDNRARRLVVLRSLELGEFEVLEDRVLGKRDGAVTTVLVDDVDLPQHPSVQVDVHRPDEGTALYSVIECGMTVPRPPACYDHDNVRRVMAGWDRFDLVFGRNR